MVRKIINTGKPWEKTIRHALGNVVDGPLLFTSGITARNPDGDVVAPNDMRQQTAQVVSNIKDILEMAGTDPSRIVKLVIYVTSIDSFLNDTDMCAELFTASPSSTLIEVQRLQIREMVIEVEAVAMV